MAVTNVTNILASEKLLYADLLVEAIQIHGHDVYYLDRELVAEDTVLGEDSLSKFRTQAPIEMYMESSEGGYAGEQEIMSQFGLQNLSEATFIVSKKRFQEKTKQIRIETATDTTSSGSILLESGSIATSKLEGETFYILNETDATDADRPLEVLQRLMRLKILSQLQVRITSLLLNRLQELRLTKKSELITQPVRVVDYFWMKQIATILLVRMRLILVVRAFYLKLVVMSILYRKTI